MAILASVQGGEEGAGALGLFGCGGCGEGCIDDIFGFFDKTFLGEQDDFGAQPIVVGDFRFPSLDNFELLGQRRARALDLPAAKDEGFVGGQEAGLGGAAESL